MWLKNVDGILIAGFLVDYLVIFFESRMKVCKFNVGAAEKVG